MAKHDIQIQSWGHVPVVVCLTCGDEETAGKLLLPRGRTTIPFIEAVDAIEAHTGEAAYRVTVQPSGERVEGQVEFGTAEDEPVVLTEVEDEPLIAYGPMESYPAGYHPRTGQQIEPGHLRRDGGPSVEEFRREKGDV